MDDLMVMVDAACLASTFVLESAGGVSLWKRHVAAWRSRRVGRDPRGGVPPGGADVR